MILGKHYWVFTVLLKTDKLSPSTLPRAGSIWNCSGFSLSLKGKLSQVAGALDVLQGKEENVLKFLAAEIHLGDTNLHFQME